mgnify:FL=1|tara:strand:- start:24838 stop:25230 length:393 start_codon:yes stop_codon:yes gene_type:complete
MRAKGTPNKPKRALLVRLTEMYGEEFNPILQMAGNAVNVQMMTNEAVADYRVKSNADEGKYDEDEIKKAASKVVVLSRESNDLWDKIAQYVTPKLKAIEMDSTVSGEVKGNWKVEFVNATVEDIDATTED